DTYEPERIAFARRLVATTDRAFQLVTSDGPFARWVRLHVVPRALPPMFASQTIRRFMFRTVSQTSIRYRGSALSDGNAGRVRAGGVCVRQRLGRALRLRRGQEPQVHRALSAVSARRAVGLSRLSLRMARQGRRRDGGRAPLSGERTGSRWGIADRRARRLS